jgi:hypothetical protein
LKIKWSTDADAEAVVGRTEREVRQSAMPMAIATAFDRNGLI